VATKEVKCERCDGTGVDPSCVIDKPSNYDMDTCWAEPGKCVDCKGEGTIEVFYERKRKSSETVD
jgi:RecJ-like exonuclease